MSCDITRILHTLIRALETTTENEISKPIGSSKRPTKASDEFSFHGRALSIHTTLLSLGEYLKRVQHLTGTTLGNRSKQKAHSDLMVQVDSLFEHCTTLLSQLKEVSGIIESTGAKLSESDQQLSQHRQAIFESLEEQFSTLRRRRDFELQRQRRLLEMSSSLAAAVRSTSPVMSSAYLRGSRATEHSAYRSYSSTVDLIESERRTTDESGLSESEMRAFERENQTMYEHLSEQKDDLHLVARAIHEIGHLNQTLSAHLSEQFETVQQIGDQFASTSEDIIQGNTLLRSALRSNASAQFWILFMMIVLTFSLHFLNWYYP